MGLRCLFGHQWNGCKCKICGKVRDESHEFDLCNGKCKKCGKPCDVKHDWNGCKCRKCGKRRDEDHDWNGCRCKICGKVRDEDHNWKGCWCKLCGKKRDEAHDWDGCKCKICGKVRDESHEFDLCNGVCKKCGIPCDVKHDWNGCKCGKCGKVHDEDHDWKGCKCKICGKVRDEDHNWKIFECTVCSKRRDINSITDQAVLADIAENDEDYKIRDVAIGKITNLIKLERIAKGKVNLNENILKKLSENALLRIAERKGYNSFKAAVILGNQKLIWENCHKEGSLMISTIREHITDQNILFDIVMNYREVTYWSNHLEEVFKKLTDQSLLTEIVKNHDDRHVREIAFLKLGSPTNLLAGMAKKGDISAIEKLTDKALLADIANNAKNCYERIAAAKNLQDKTILVEIANNTKNNHHDRIHAVNAIADKVFAQKLFSDIIENDSDWNARYLAIRYSTDKVLLTQIANGGAKYIYEYRSAGYDDNIGRTTYTLKIDLCEEARSRLRYL